MLNFDVEASRKVEAAYSTRDLVEQRQAVLDLLAVQPGEHALDIGVGPGYLAGQLAEAAGPQGRVCGIDISDSMLAIAGTRAEAPGRAAVELVLGGADSIPYPDSTFDLAVSTQVLEYVADIPAALAEIHRVLRPGGRVLILDTDWDSIVWRSADDDRMRRVLKAWEQHLADPFLPRRLRGGLQEAGLRIDSIRVIPMLNTGDPKATLSGGLIDLIAGFVLGRNGLTADEVDAWRDDLRSQGEDYFFSLNRYVFLATKPADGP